MAITTHVLKTTLYTIVTWKKHRFALDGERILLCSPPWSPSGTLRLFHWKVAKWASIWGCYEWILDKVPYFWICVCKEKCIVWVLNQVGFSKITNIHEKCYTNKNTLLTTNSTQSHKTFFVYSSTKVTNCYCGMAPITALFALVKHNNC